WELRVKGWTQWRIATELGLSQPAICKILERVCRQAVAELKDQVQQAKFEQLQLLDHIVDQAMQSWELSKTPSQSQTTRKTTAGQGGGAGGVGEIKTIHLENQFGNPKYLDEARAAMSDIRRILGCDAPEKVAMTDPSGTQEAQAVTPGLVERM